MSGDENGKGSNYVILQDYVHGAEQGDVRILMLNGEPIGAMKRIPASNDVRSNVHAGGTVVKHRLTAQEKKLCKYIGPKLVRDGLYFTGIDVIGGKIFTDKLDHTPGTLTINSALIVDSDGNFLLYCLSKYLTVISKEFLSSRLGSIGNNFFNSSMLGENIGDKNVHNLMHQLHKLKCFVPSLF